MSGIFDARVLAAFSQGIQRPYMLGVEQRLTRAESSLDKISGDEAGSRARLNNTFLRITSSFSTTSSTAVDVTGAYMFFTTYGGDLLLIASAEEFYVQVTSGGATGEVGFSVDGKEEWVYSHVVSAGTTDNYGLIAIRAFDVPAGDHTIKLRARTNAGTLNIRAGATWPFFMMAVEL